MNQHLAAIKSLIRLKLESVPDTMRQEDSSRRIITSIFYNAAEQMGLLPLPGWKPPRSTRESLDMVALQPELQEGLPRIAWVMVSDPLVELPRVRALEWVECPYKIYVTFSPRIDKVKPTTLFLKQDYIHLDIFS